MVTTTTQQTQAMDYSTALELIYVYGNNKRTLRVEWTHSDFENIIFESADTISVSAMTNAESSHLSLPPLITSLIN